MVPYSVITLAEPKHGVQVHLGEVPPRGDVVAVAWELGPPFGYDSICLIGQKSSDLVAAQSVPKLTVNGFETSSKEGVICLVVTFPEFIQSRFGVHFSHVTLLSTVGIVGVSNCVMNDEAAEIRESGDDDDSTMMVWQMLNHKLHTSLS